MMKIYFILMKITMNFTSQLYRANFIQRNAKLLAEVQLENGEHVLAYLPNMTDLNGVLFPGGEVYLSYNSNEFKRLHYVVELVNTGASLVGVNIDHHLDLFVEAVAGFPELSGYKSIMPAEEHTVFDAELVSEQDEHAFVVIAPIYEKNGMALTYPDGIMVGNRQIIRQIDQALEDKHKVFFCLLAQRQDFIEAKINWQTDPAFVTELKKLCEKGLEIFCCGCSVTMQGIQIINRCPFNI